MRVDSIGTGHTWPSGAAHDRRAWLEVIAYRADNSIVFQSGVVPDGMDPEEINDPNLFGLWDRAFKDDGTPAHFFWDVAHGGHRPRRCRGRSRSIQNDPAFDHSRTATYGNLANVSEIDHITVRMRIRPLPFADARRARRLGRSLRARSPRSSKTLEIEGTHAHVGSKASRARARRRERRATRSGPTSSARDAEPVDDLVGRRRRSVTSIVVSHTPGIHMLIGDSLY